MQQRSWLVVAVVLFTLVLTTLSIPATFAETATSELVFKAPWGKELGQFGFFDPKAGLPEDVEPGGSICGPEVFTMSGGFVYIHDTVNGRVEIYSLTEKKFRTFETKPLGRIEDIAVDATNNIYLAYTSNVRGREFCLVKYNQAGRMLQETFFNLPLDKFGGIAGSYSLIVADNGEVYANVVASPKGESLRYCHLTLIKNGKTVADLAGSAEDRHVARSGNELRPVDQKLGHILGMDSQGNTWRKESNFDRKTIRICQYSPEGQQLTSFTIPIQVYTGVKKPLVLDGQGNLWQMSTLPDGISITRWSLVFKGGE